MNRLHMPATTRDARVWIAFVLLSAIWGSSYLFIRIGLEQLTPLSLVALRLLAASAGIGIIAAARRQSLAISWHTFGLMCVVAVVNIAIPFLLITWGEVVVPSGLTSVLNSTVPIFALLIGIAALRDEPVIWPRVAGLALGFGGVVLLVSRSLGGSAAHWLSIAGELAIVLASVSYACNAVLSRRSLRNVPPIVTATYSVWLAGALILVASLIFSPPHLASMHPKTILSVLWLGVLGSALAYVLSFYILQNWPASQATLVSYMVPVVGLPLGAIVLHEAVGWRILLGSLMVIGGVVLARIGTRPQKVNVASPTARRAG